MIDKQKITGVVYLIHYHFSRFENKSKLFYFVMGLHTVVDNLHEYRLITSIARFDL